MITKDLIYTEMRSEDGFMLTNGEIYTDYVCVLKKDDCINEWKEVTMDEVPDKFKNQQE